ncbi:ASKHA domain-containing protein [Chloroflexota bacterium]
MAKNLSAKKVKIHFSPDNVDIIAEQGENLLQVAIAAGVHLTASCGGAGVCGTCKVLIKEGAVESIRTEKITDDEYRRGLRQACQSRILTDINVDIPLESKLERVVFSREAEKTSKVLATDWRFKPPLTKFFLELPKPSISDNSGDLSRLLRGLKHRSSLSNISVDFSVVKKLAKTLRDGRWKITVTTLITAARPSAREEWRRPRVINVEAGDTRKMHYSLAFDIGTTTVCGQLLDLNRGKVMAENIAYNGQIDYGADVITRIAYSQTPGGLKRLQRVVVATINGIIEELLVQSQVKVKDIGHIMLAGNTTMTQIIMGLDPKYIRLAPYVPVANLFPPVAAKTLGIKVGQHVYLFAFPSVASYVGGDIVSGIVGAGVHQRENLTLFIDIGTNGEIVVGNSDWMATAACSAGPAFEGGGIKHGVVATEGAIEDFKIKPDTLEQELSTIGGKKPKGICGSGLINIVAGLLKAGVIDQSGKFNPHLSTKRIRKGRDGYEYLLSPASDNKIAKDIVITEIDINNLMRAKGAIYAGCQTLSKSAGVACTDFKQVIIAGAFGSKLNIERAITIGLLPDLPLDRFAFIGNGSLLGARLTSFSRDLLDDARRVANMMTNFELSENVDFMNDFIAALFLPHTNTAEFPSVTKNLARLHRDKSKQRVII